MKELWKDIPDYVGLYQASTLGNIRSLDRTVRHGHGGTMHLKGRILKSCINNMGYSFVILSSGSNCKMSLIHKLVASAFIGPCKDGYVVDHLNEDYDDNRLLNLQIIKKRENECKAHRHKNKRRGVYYGRWGWIAKITINNKSVHLGTFEDKDEAYDEFYIKYFEEHGIVPWSGEEE